MGRRRGARARTATIVLVAGLVGAGAVASIAEAGAGSGTGAGTDSGTRRPSELVESPECDRAAEHPAASASSASGQRISVTVPAVAVIRLDRSGRVEAAMTNTGCAPRRSDEVHVMTADGTVRDADRRDLGRYVTAPRWVGDFTQVGVFQLQR